MKAFNLSRFTRLWLVIASCTVFFFVEIAIGLHTKSLALIVDAFHMLNDLISYVVALVAAKDERSELMAQLAASNKQRPGFTYALKRCEVVGAFFNSSILLALAMSIFLQSMERFIEVPEVESPLFVLIVGCLGLGLNVFCVLICHATVMVTGTVMGTAMSIVMGMVIDIVTKTIMSTAMPMIMVTIIQADQPNGSTTHDPDLPARRYPIEDDLSIQHEVRAVKVPNIASQIYAPISHYMHSHHSNTSRDAHQHSQGADRIHMTATSKFTIFGHPISSYGRSGRIPQHLKTRTSDIKETSPGLQDVEKHASLDPGSPMYALPQSEKWYQNDDGVIRRERKGRSGLPPSPESSLSHHHIAHAAEAGAVHDKGNEDGHSHGSHMGISGVMLHVAGDAINNLGVVIAALFMWLTPWPSRFYADPGVSVLIGIIIFAGSVPLTLRSARLLLEAAPKGMDVGAIQNELSEISGVASVHCLHIWQLTESDLVGSLDVRATARDLVVWSLTEMQIRRTLAQHGVYHVTICPEFVIESEVKDPAGTEGRPEDRACKLIRGE